MSALVANTARISWSIQNLFTSPLYVLMGSGASSSVFHVALNGGTAADDGKGGTFTQDAGVVYNGIVTVASTTTRYVVTEIAP